MNARPFPESLHPNDRDRWTVSDTPALRAAIEVQPDQHQLRVPTGSDAESVALRRFATLRAAMEALDPAAQARELAQNELAQMGIDQRTAARIAHLADLWRIAHHARAHNLADLDTIRDPALAHRARREIDAGDTAAAIGTYVEAQQTGDSRSVSRAITDARPDLGPVLQTLKRRATNTLNNRHAARALGHERTVPVDDPATGERTANAASRHAWHQTTELLRWISRAIQESAHRTTSGDTEQDDQSQTIDAEELDTLSLWYPLRVWRGIMTTPHLGMLARTSRRRVTNGRSFADPARLYTDPDRRAFYRRARANGGTVVVDVSGSMSLRAEDVAAIMEAAGGATIYAYQHTHPERPTLWTLAERGRTLSDLPAGFTPGGSNGVDAPALRYAAERHDPRQPFYWVTDGNYNGRAASTGNSILATDCYEVCTAAHAITVPTIADAVDQLHRIARGGHPDAPSMPTQVTSNAAPYLLTDPRYTGRLARTQVGRLAPR